jgi:hypothetical protein
MIITTAGPVDRDAVNRFVQDIQTVMPVTDIRSAQFRSAQSPEFVQLLSDAAQWFDPLKVAVTVFLSQLAKEAAKDVWKHKTKIAIALKDVAVTPLRVISSSISRLLISRPRGTLHITIGLPWPDNYFGAWMDITTSDEQQIAWIVANFVIHAERIQQAIQNEMNGDRRPSGAVSLTFQDDGSFLLRWMDSKDLQIHELIIS